MDRTSSEIKAETGQNYEQTFTTQRIKTIDFLLVILFYQIILPADSKMSFNSVFQSSYHLPNHGVNFTLSRLTLITT